MYYQKFIPLVGTDNLSALRAVVSVYLLQTAQRIEQLRRRPSALLALRRRPAALLALRRRPSALLAIRR